MLTVLYSLTEWLSYFFQQKTIIPYYSSWIICAPHSFSTSHESSVLFICLFNIPQIIFSFSAPIAITWIQFFIFFFSTFALTSISSKVLQTANDGPWNILLTFSTYIHYSTLLGLNLQWYQNHFFKPQISTVTLLLKSLYCIYVRVQFLSWNKLSGFFLHFKLISYLSSICYIRLSYS